MLSVYKFSNQVLETQAFMQLTGKEKMLVAEDLKMGEHFARKSLKEVHQGEAQFLSFGTYQFQVKQDKAIIQSQVY